MSELLASSRPTEPNTELYLESLGAARTARHASEEFHSPEPTDVSQAVRVIRQEISPAFDTHEHEAQEPTSLEQMKQAYWTRASQVGTEHGAKLGYDLEMYLKVGEKRSYADIRNEIEHEYTDEKSVPRSVLDGIDAYSEVLKINPAHATTIVMELIGRNFAVIGQRAQELRKGEAVSGQASAQAFSEFITTEVPHHLNTIIDKYGYGDDAIRPVMNKASFYPVTNADNENVTLTLREQDAMGLVEAYDVQSRPYDDEALAMGNELAHIPAMQTAMIRLQEELVATSTSYLDAHPERAAGNLENFSEIFVPKHGQDGLELLPNPKLLRAMVNNVMPAVALSLMRRDAPIEMLTAEDINEGIRIAAKEYKLFQSRIGQFDNYDPAAGTVELHATFQVVCPANSLFPNYLTANLAKFYDEAMVA